MKKKESKGEEMETKQSQIELDVRDLQKLGYVQELFREMGGFSNFAVSFSVISILTGATQLYGYGLSHGGPLQMSLGWLLVSFFTMLVALAMAELASMNRLATAGQLSGSIAHEINQPITGMVLKASAALRWLAGSA